jgi:hypothetical protein
MRDQTLPIEDPQKRSRARALIDDVDATLKSLVGKQELLDEDLSVVFDKLDLLRGIFFRDSLK